MHVHWVGVALGAGAIVVGVILFLARAPWAKLSQSIQKSAFGKYGEDVAANATPRTFAVVSIAFVCIGILMVLLSFFYHSH